MSLDYDQLVDDLEAEQAAIGRVLEQMPESAWDLQTHAPGWLVRDQVAHLAYFDEKAAFAINDPDAFRDEVAKTLAGELGNVEQGYIARDRAMTTREVLDWWRKASSDLIRAARPLDAKTRMPWYGPDMSGASFVTARLMETWSHGLDVVDVVGI
ncbi:maleylpyruvate isomerase family mycothiol-dependent enzyme, partial [bacterium]